ncbi:MAG: NosD domain-containing protein [Halobacteriota archaeon]
MRNKQLLVGIALLALLVLCAFVGTGSATTILVPSPGNETIQQAVNNSSSYDIIIVKDGIYIENIDVTKANLTIRSENGSANCVVNASNPGDHVFYVTADSVNISGFKAQNATANYKAGIYLTGADYCTISENTASNNDCGIYLQSSSNNNLTGNTANSNIVYGIYLQSSSNNNNLTGNAVSNNWGGITLYQSSNSNTLTGNTANSNNAYGINLYQSSSNNLTGNTVSNNNYGIWLDASSTNDFTCNWVHNNTGRGFYLTPGSASSANNTIEHNNIMTNGNYNVTSGGYEYDFYNEQANAVDAKYNYWMAATNETIDASIYDNEEGEGKGEVTFYPFMSESAPCAPIPELPTILLLSTGLLVLLGYGWVKREKKEH